MTKASVKSEARNVKSSSTVLDVVGGLSGGLKEIKKNIQIELVQERKSLWKLSKILKAFIIFPPPDLEVERMWFMKADEDIFSFFRIKKTWVVLRRNNFFETFL